MNERLKTLISTQGVEIQDLQRENQNIRNQLDEQTVQIQTLQGENQDLKNRLGESLARNERQDDLIKELKTQSDQQQITIDQTKDRLERLEGEFQLQRRNRQASEASRDTTIRSDSPPTPPGKSRQSLEEVDNVLNYLFKQFNPPPDVTQAIDAFRNHLLQKNCPNIDEEMERADDQQLINLSGLVLLVFSMLKIATSPNQYTDNVRKPKKDQNTQPIFNGTLSSAKISPRFTDLSNITAPPSVQTRERM